MPVTLLDLKPDACRWPVNDGGPFLFCGEVVASPLRPYCAAHAARAVGQGTPSERYAVRTLRRQVDHEAPMSRVE